VIAFRNVQLPPQLLQEADGCCRQGNPLTELPKEEPRVNLRLGD